MSPSWDGVASRRSLSSTKTSSPESRATAHRRGCAHSRPSRSAEISESAKSSTNVPALRPVSRRLSTLSPTVRPICVLLGVAVRAGIESETPFPARAWNSAVDQGVTRPCPPSGAGCRPRDRVDVTGAAEYVERVTVLGMPHLAGSFDRDLPGLPRGRGSLAADEVLDAQRKRILRAAISSTADKGIAATTVADIVGRARVSRQAFYKQFESKDACLIAAIDAGIESILSAITTTQDSSADLSLREQLSAVIGRYLEKCSAEPEFVRAWVLDLPVAGAAGIAKRNEYVELLADTLRSGFRHAPQAPNREMFIAAIGGCYELFYRHVSSGAPEPYTSLHAPILLFLERILDPTTDHS